MTVNVTLSNGSIQVISNATDLKIDSVAKTATVVIDLTNTLLVEAQ